MKQNNRYRNRGSRSVRLLLQLAGLGVAGFTNSVVMAQPGPYSIYRDIGDSQAEGDVVNLTAGVGITRDSNILRISDQADPRPYGSDSRSDTVLNGLLGISFDRRISQQRLQASAQVQGFKYNNFGDFDNIGYDAGLNYDWVIGRPFFGRAGGRFYRYQPPIQDRNIGQSVVERNQVERQTIYLNGGVRITPSWSAIAGWDLDRRRNTSSLYEDSDADYNSLEAGARFAPGTGLEVDFVYRRTDGDYKIQQVNGPDGLPLLGGPRSNNFKQDALLARISYRPTEESRIAGRIGYTDRSYDVDSSRDFGGITTGFDITWAQSGAVQWLVSFSRDIEPDDSAITAGYADAKSFAIRPTIQATGKIRVMPFFQYVDRDFKGEGGIEDRREDFQAFGLTVDYEIRRNLNALLDLRREQRNSNADVLDFDANIISLGLQVRF